MKNTWAALVVFGSACIGDPGGPDTTVPGDLLLTVSTDGATLDGDGYTVTIIGVGPRDVEVNDTVEIPDLVPGRHAVALTGLASNCRAAPPQPRTVVITPAEQTALSLSVRCDSLLRNAIIFARIDNGLFTIYWMPPAGSPPIPIIAGGSPTISPDGARIAFDRAGLGHVAIWTANVDGTNAMRLTFDGDVNQMPRWSPDGQRIAFVSNRDGNYEIYTMRPDGSDPRRLTANPAQDISPRWSPDGHRLAFTRTLEPPTDSDVFLMNADGTGAANVTKNPDGDTVLDWAPSGDRLLINSNRGLQSNEIFTIDLDGSNVVNLTNHEAFDADAAWSPAGDAFVFGSYRDGEAVSLYRADADGQNVVRLTTPTGTQVDYSPTWVP